MTGTNNVPTCSMRTPHSFSTTVKRSVRSEWRCCTTTRSTSSPIVVRTSTAWPNSSIFGAGDIARLAHYYFTTDSDHEVAGFAVDAEYRTEPEFQGLPLVTVEEVTERFPPPGFKMFVALSYAKMNAVRAAKYSAEQALGYELVSYVSTRCCMLCRSTLLATTASSSRTTRFSHTSRSATTSRCGAATTSATTRRSRTTASSARTSSSPATSRRSDVLHRRQRDAAKLHHGRRAAH